MIDVGARWAYMIEEGGGVSRIDSYVLRLSHDGEGIGEEAAFLCSWRLGVKIHPLLTNMVGRCAVMEWQGEILRGYGVHWDSPCPGCRRSFLRTTRNPTIIPRTGWLEGFFPSFRIFSSPPDGQEPPGCGFLKILVCSCLLVPRGDTRYLREEKRYHLTPVDQLHLTSPPFYSRDTLERIPTSGVPLSSHLQLLCLQ